MLKELTRNEKLWTYIKCTGNIERAHADMVKQAWVVFIPKHVSRAMAAVIVKKPR